MPRLSGRRSGRPPDALPFAPRGAPSEPLPTGPAVPAPPSRRRGPAAGDRHRHGGRRSRVLGAWIERAAAALLSGSAAIRDDASARGRTFPASGGETRPDARRRAVAAVPVWVLLGFAALLLACAATLGADAASAAVLIENNGQTTSSNKHDLADHDVAQAFTTGNTGDTYELDSIQVRFNTVPSATATVTAIVADGRDTGSTVIELTNPGSWTVFTKFTAPDDTILAANTTYHLIIDGSEGELVITAGNGENTGGATGWSIGNSRYRRSMTTDNGVGGTWASSADALKIRVEGTIIPPSTEARLSGLQVSNGTFSPAFDKDKYVYDVAVAPTISQVTISPTAVDGDDATIEYLTANGNTQADADTTEPDFQRNLLVGNNVTKIKVTAEDGVTTKTYTLTILRQSTDADLSLVQIDGSAPTPRFHEDTTTYTKAVPLATTQVTISAFGKNNQQTIEFLDESDNTLTDQSTTDIGFQLNISEGDNVVKIKVTAGDGVTTKTYTITISPTAPPAVSSVAITSTPANASTYIIGDDIVFTVTFDKDLTLEGSNTSKPPATVLWLLDYATDRPGVDDPEANCAIGTNTKTLVCLQTVSEGWYDNDGIAIGANAVVQFRPITFVVGPLGQQANDDHSARPIDSNHKVDGIRPTLSRADADQNDLTKIILTFSEVIKDPDRTKITVKKGGATQTTTVAQIDPVTQRKVTLTLMTALLSTDTDVTVDLAADAVKDLPGNGIAEVLGTSVSVEDNTAPTFVSAGTNDTDEVVLTYSEALNTTAPAKSAFTVKVGGSNRGVDTVAISGSAVTLTLASAFRPGDTLTVAYTKPGTNPIKDAADNEAGDLAETTVTNNLADTAPEAPGNLAAAPDPVSGTPPRVYADRMVLTWDTPWDNGDAITGYKVRHVEGSSAGGTFAAIAGSATSTISHTVTGLKPGTEYTFEVLAVNVQGDGAAATVTETTATPAWSFTLRDTSNNNVTELTEGGDAATAEVSITNNVRFGADQTVTLAWGTVDLMFGSVVGAGSATAITISAEQASGSLEISSPQFPGAVYGLPATHSLTATHGETEIGSIELTRLDDESVPVATISAAPSTVNEGDDIDVTITLTPPFDSPVFLNLAVTDTDTALSGTLPTTHPFGPSDGEDTITLTAAENTTQNDGAHDVTFALQLNDDSPYTLGTPPAVTSVTITVRDDDTPPLAPRNLTAQAGNTEATLRWDPPPASNPDHGQPVLHYEYRVKVGTAAFGSWTTIPNSDADTRSHKFTGLTNGTEYTYEVRAENVAGDGAEAEVMVTPLVGVAVSFGAATLSVNEGGTGQATVTLATAPATGVTVTVPITATPGEGLGTGEYSVPASVTFAAGDTSKSFTVSATQDTLDEPDEVLTLSLGTLPAGYVPGTTAELEITVVDDDVAQLGLTLRDSGGNDVTQLVEGGASATATVSITNNVRFSTEQTVQLKWGTLTLGAGELIQGAGGATVITIPANGASGSLVISSPQRPGANHFPDTTLALTATHGDTEIGSIDLTRVDDEGPPVASITQAPATVNEGDGIEIEVTLSVGYSGLGRVRFTVTDSDGALSGTLPDSKALSTNATEFTVTLTAAENTVMNDGTREVVFMLEPSNDQLDVPYTLGTPPAVTSVTITVRDDDTPPLAPENLRAQAGNTEATLRWDPPLASTPDHGQPVLHYESRVKVGTAAFGSWATIPNSDGSTRSHTFTGLTNDQEYTYEVRAENVAGDGAEAEVMVTPIVGVAVSFGAAALSVDEGDDATVTVTLATAPAVGETVTMPLTATPGAGLNSSEYSGVPSSVTFNAGQTSRSFTVATVDDTDDEPDRTLTLSLGTLPEGYVPGTHSQLVLTLVDDDVPIVSATFGRATASVAEGVPFDVTVSLSQAPEREVVVPINATRGANLAADEYEGVPADVTFTADAIETRFTVTFTDDALEEGNETLTLAFGTLPDRVNSAGANPQLVLTVVDDDGPPAAPDVSVQTGDGFADLSWAPVANDSPVLRYEVRWRETDGGAFNAWLSVGLVTSYRVEGLTNGKAHEFQVRAVNAHGTDEDEIASAPGTPSQVITNIPTAVQGLWVRATDSSRAELSWWQPANATDEDHSSNPNSMMSQIQGYRIEVCRTTCDDETNWYALVPNTGKFEHRYTHQVLAPGVIRENRYRVRAININGKSGPWSNVAWLPATEVENVYLQTPDDSTLWVRFRVRNPDGNKLYVRYTNTGTDAMGHTDYRLTKKEDNVKLVLSGLAADTWYRVELDFSPDFDSERRTSWWYGTAKKGHTPLTSPYAKDLLDAQVFRGGQWREAPDNELYVRMGGTGKYRVRLKPCGSIYNVRSVRIQAPAGRLRASPTDTDPSLFTNLNCEVAQDGWRTDENGNRLTLGDVYDMTNFPAHANDHIPIYAGTPNNWHEVTVTARALEDYPADTRADALLSAPFAVVYNHAVWYGSHDTRSGPVSEGTGLVRISLDRPADAVLPEPSGVAIADPAGGSANPVMSWDAVDGAWGYLVEWRHGLRYSNRANRNRSLRAETSVTLPLGASRRGPITARVRAYSGSGVSGWVERTWDSRAPTLNVLDTAVNEADGSVGFLVTLSPAASGTVTVDYTTVDGTAVEPADYEATSGTVTFAPARRGSRRRWCRSSTTARRTAGRRSGWC